MTMYTLPNFCRVCLKYDKNLIDLEHIENEPNETLISKLQLCVSEVEWDVFKPLLCHPCIKKLNIAHGFKKQCMQSASVLKNYIALVEESKRKTDSTQIQHIDITGGDSNTNASPQNNNSAYMALANNPTKFLKIYLGPSTDNNTVGGANSNTFQNVFLNLVPASTITPVAVATADTTSARDTNQNVFLNFSNATTLQQQQKYVTPVPHEQLIDTNKGAVNVNQLLTESKSEELSVEIDPTDFDLDEQSSDNNEDAGDEKDWDDLISHSQIISSSGDQKISTISLVATNRLMANGGDNKASGELKGNENNRSSSSGGNNNYGSNYVPILPKQQQQNDDFFNSGRHFLSSSTISSPEIICDACNKKFSSIKQLKQHLKVFHLGKYPFQCEYCFREFLLRGDYEVCIKTHKLESDALNSNNSLTLNDFKNDSSSMLDQSQSSDVDGGDFGDYYCESCNRHFTSSSGLLRHKVRKHNQKNKKKYFIKGMKNARCDVCNREFSTQSYMQLHRKLHLRDDIGYKYKVFGRSVYNKVQETSQEDDDFVTTKKINDEKASSDNSDTDEEKLIININSKSQTSKKQNLRQHADLLANDEIKMEIEEIDPLMIKDEYQDEDSD